jgi:hypothetical protein
MYNLLDLVIKIDALINLDWGHAPPRNVHNIRSSSKIPGRLARLPPSFFPDPPIPDFPILQSIRNLSILTNGGQMRSLWNNVK